MAKKVNFETKILTGSLVFALGVGVGFHSVLQANAEDRSQSGVVTDSSENHLQDQPKGQTVEYGGVKYSLVSKYVASDHEALAWDFRAQIGTKSSQVAVFTDQLQPGQIFYTGGTPNHTILTDDEWTKANGQQSSYGDLTVRVGSRSMTDDTTKNGQDLKTGVLKYIAPDYLSGLDVDDAMAKAGTVKTASDVKASSSGDNLTSSGYKQGDTDKTKADTDQLGKLMGLVKSQAITGLNTSNVGSNQVDNSKVDYSKIQNVGVQAGPNGFYTYDASTRQLKFVVYNLEKVQADADLIKQVVKSLGGADKVNQASTTDVANAAQAAGATSDVVKSISDADTVAATSDTIVALNFTNLYMHEVRITVPVAVTAGNVIPNQFDYAGFTWDGNTMKQVGDFEVSNKPQIIVPSPQQKAADPDKPYKNILKDDNVTLLNGYNWYGKASDDTINADDQDDSKSAEVAFAAGSPLTFEKNGDYTVKEKADFAPGVYIVRTLDGKDIKAEIDGHVLSNGQLLSVNAGSDLKILDGSGQFQLIDATTAFAKAASAQSIAKLGDNEKSKTFNASAVEGKDAGIDYLLKVASASQTNFTWVVSQPIPKNLQSVSGVDIKLIDDLAQDDLQSLKIVDTKDPNKVIADVTDEAKADLKDVNGKVVDGQVVKDSDGLQLSKNLLVYHLKDYSESKYGDTVSFAITVKGSNAVAHKDTASVQLFKDGSDQTKGPQPTNTVKITTAQPKVVQPTNPVQPDNKQDTSNPGTPNVQNPAYVPANEPSRVDTPLSEALGDVANDSDTPAAASSLAATGAYLASNLWFLILFPVAVFGTAVEYFYKSKTGRFLTINELRRRFASR